MKKILALLLVAFASASAHGAYITNGQDLLDPSVSSNPARIIKVIPSNASGTPIPTPSSVPGGSNVVLNGISGAAAISYYDKLTNSVATLLGAITSSAQSQSADCPSTVTMGITWSQTPTAYNLTTTASCATCQIRPEVNAGSGGAAVRYICATFTASAADLASSGHYMSSSSTVQVRQYYAPGTILTVASTSSTNVTGSLSLNKRVNFGGSCP